MQKNWVTNPPEMETDNNRDDNGQYLSPPPNAHTITTVDASKLAHRRWEISRIKANESLEETVQELVEKGKIHASKYGTGDGWKEVVRHAVTIFFQSDSARDVATLGGFITKVTGNSPDAIESTRDEQRDEHRAQLIEDALILSQVFEYRNSHRDIITVESQDVT